MRLSSNILSVTAAVLASFMTRGADALTLEEQWSIELVNESVEVNFNQDYEAREVFYKLRVAGQNFYWLRGSKVLDYATCKVGISTEMISAISKQENMESEIGTGYTQIPIFVDIDTAKFEEGRDDEYFSKVEGTNEVKLKFCIKTDLGDSTVYELDDEGNEVNPPKYTPISYTKVKFNITIDMETGFSTDIEIEEENASTASKEVVIDYGLTAYECNDNDTEIDNPPAKNQNSMVRICIDTPTDNDVVIASIKNFKLKSDLIASNAIKDNVRNALTEVEGEGSKTVAVTTQMVSAFFSDLDPAVTDNTIDIEGTAVMEFKATGTRKLVRISSNNQKNHGNVSDMDRKLDGDAGLGEFAMKVGISKSSSEANGAATSGASNALSATPLVTVTSLALGGVLMGTMF